MYAMKYFYQNLNMCIIDEFWFKDYLSDRIHSVKINSVLSSPKSMRYGVQQESVLGPIYF